MSLASSRRDDLAAPRSSLQGLRILFVLPSLGLGGAERQAFLFARHLRKVEGADVRLLAFSRQSAIGDACVASGLRYDFFDFRHKYRSRVGHLRDLVRFTRLLRRHRPHILLPYCMFQDVLCGLTWRAGGAGVCIWNQRDEGRARLEPWIERLAVGQIPRFISNSCHGAAFLQRELRVPADRISVIANGVEIPEPGPSSVNWHARLGIGSDAFLACMVANLHSKKDHATLISAWRIVVDQNTTGRPLHLALAGRHEDQYEFLVRQVASLSLQPYVHFLGEIREVNDLLRSVDLAVFSSFTEGVPNAVLEAMAHGLAVVATDSEGIREATGPDGAFLASPCDPAALAQRILTIANDAGLRARIGERGRHRVQDTFGVQRMAAQMTSAVSEEWLKSARRYRKRA